MKQLAILALVFGVSACLASVSWGQHYHHGGRFQSGYSGYGGSRTSVVVGFGNFGGYGGGWGYGYQPYYAPSRVTYYRGYPYGSGFGYSAYSGYYRPIYPPRNYGYGPGCGNGFGNGVYIGW
jgi:hypothetical protein